MKRAIDSAGRVVIQEEMRERDGIIEIEAALTPVKLVRRSGPPGAPRARGRVGHDTLLP